MLLDNKIIYNDDKSIGYIISNFKSSNVLESTYFPNNNTLYITYIKGNIYSYINIDIEMYNKFIESESQGKFINENFKNNNNIIHRKEYNLFREELEELKNNINNKINNI